MARRTRLPPLTDRQLRSFKENHLRGKKPHSVKLGDNALRSWQLHLNLKGSHEIGQDDIYEFISMLENEREQKARTIAHYLGQLVPLFSKFYSERVAEAANDQKNRLMAKARLEDRYYPIPSTDLKAIYNNASRKGKVIIHILLLEDKIKIGKIPELHGKTGDFLYYGEEKSENKKQLHFINKETDYAVKDFLESNENDGSAFFSSMRKFDLYVEDLVKPAHFPITAISMRKFGRYMPKEDLIRWLKEDACPTCGREYNK